MEKIADSQEFCISRKVKTSVVGTAILFIFLLASFVYVGFKQARDRFLIFSIALVLLIITLGLLIAIIGLSRRYRVTSSDISLILPIGKQYAILWSEITGIKNDPFLQRLVLETSDAKKNLSIGRSVNGYEELVNQIRDHTGDRFLFQLKDTAGEKIIDQPHLQILKASTVTIIMSLFLMAIGSILLFFTGLPAKLLGWAVFFIGILFIVSAINTRFSNRKPLTAEGTKEMSTESPVFIQRGGKIRRMLIYGFLLLIYFIGLFAIFYMGVKTH